MTTPILVCEICPTDHDGFYTKEPAKFDEHLRGIHGVVLCPKCGMDGYAKYAGLCSWCWLEKYRE